MRNGMIAAAVLSLGSVALPSMAQAGERDRDHRGSDQVVRHEVVRDVRPVEVRHEVVRDVRPAERRHEEFRDVGRDVRVEDRVIVDRERHHDWDRHEYIRHDYDRHDWDRHEIYIPAPCVPAPEVIIAPQSVVTPVAIEQVPPVVLSAAAQLTGSAPIVGVNFVQNGPALFYDVSVAGPYNTVRTLRFGINGGFYGNV